MESSVQDRTAPGARTADAPDPTRDQTAQAQTARVVETKPVTADPGPLGLAAFALTTFVLSIFNSGLPIVLGLALAYGGFAQLLAGMWEFRTGNTFGAVAFTSYGAFWISFWAFEQFYAKEITDKVALGNAVGLFLIGWGIFTAYMFIASLRTSVAISVVFFLLATTFIVLGIGDAEANKSITHIGGFIGIATAIAAWYASFAAVTNSTFGRTVLPVKELKK
jgi:succinate-acetate transporter protein